jgi:hypothetical protein
MASELMAEAKALPKLSLESFTGPVYGDVLFHGPEFQVIKTVDGVSQDGIQAELDGTDPVVALDGGLQLALLFAKHTLGGKSLPMRVGAAKSYAPLTGGPVQCALVGQVGRQKVTADITFSREGRVLAALEGVEAVLLPE